MIIALCGPSGIGKGYFKETLIRHYPRAREIVWYTTRPLRPGEKNRKEISEAEFLELQEKGELALEQGMFGHRYAVKKSDLLERGGIYLTEIHPFVLETAKEINPDIVAIGLVTDDFDLLRDRLANRRKTETPEEIERRLEAAKLEIEAVKEKPDLYFKVLNITSENEKMVKIWAMAIFEEIRQDKGKEMS